MIKMLPNLLTLLRLILTSILNVYILNNYGSVTVPIIISIIIFLTDFLDGKIARHLGNESRFGAVFDIIADLYYIAVSYIVLSYMHIIPVWFLFIILFKFIEFTSTSFLINKQRNGKSMFVFDFTGRFAAVLFYIIPLLAYVSFQISQLLYIFIANISIYITTLMVCISSAYRLGIFTKILRVGRNTGKSAKVPVICRVYEVYSENNLGHY